MRLTGQLELTTQKLIHIAESFCDRVGAGVEAWNSEIKCLPAFIPVAPSLSGEALVLDVGGTRMRTAVMAMGQWGATIKKGPLEEELPLKRGKPLRKEDFLQAQVRLIKTLCPEPGLPLGYCFSYPATGEPDGDARLIRWTKGVSVPGMEGEKVGQALVEALNDQGVSVSRCMVLNDTTASLLAGMARGQSDAHIGLVVGTGTNMATLVPSSALVKLDPALLSVDQLPVNLESGNFNPQYLTPWDERVDRESDNPGEQRFEKAVSGAYLARILKAAMPQVDCDADKGAKLLSQWVGQEAPDSDKRRLAQAILDRSARLVAASLAGLLRFLNGFATIDSAVIVAEGGLILNSKGFKAEVEKTLGGLVQDLELKTTRIEMVHIPHANLVGSAWAALSGIT